MPTAQNFFVITGGPCSGKTTLVHALKKEGYAAIEEVLRATYYVKKNRMAARLHHTKILRHF